MPTIFPDLYLLNQPEFWARPIDQVLFDCLILFGWIPLFVILFWGFALMWKNHREGIYNSRLKWVLLAIDVPSMTEQSPKSLENFLTSLAGSLSAITWKEKWLVGKFQPSFSFEIASNEGYIQFFVRAQERFRDVIEAGIYAQYPDAEITEAEDYTADFPHHFPDENYDMWGAELTLKKDSHYPIRTFVDFEDQLTQELKDPIGQVLELLAKMRPGEHFWIQVIIQPANTDWKDAGVKAIEKLYGIEKVPAPSGLESAFSTLMSIPDGILESAFGFTLFGAAPKKKETDPWKAFKLTPIEIETAKAIYRKISKPGFNVKVREVYIARKEAYSKMARITLVKGLFNQYAHLHLNGFTMYPPSIPKDDYFWMKWEYAGKQTRLLNSYRKRSFSTGATPKVLNVEEIATIWHFPQIGVKAPLIKKTVSKRAEPPVDLPFGMDDIMETAGKKPPAPFMTEGETGEQSPGVPSHPTTTTEVLSGLESMLEQPADLHIPDAAAPVARPLPLAHAHEEAEEKEEGLDSKDFTESADVVLPGPPPGFSDADVDPTKDDESLTPPNLPV